MHALGVSCNDILWQHLCDTNDHLVTRVTVPYTQRPPRSSMNPTPDKTSQSRVRTCGDTVKRRMLMRFCQCLFRNKVWAAWRFRETVGLWFKRHRFIVCQDCHTLSLSSVLMGMQESCALWQPLADLLSNFQRWMNGSGRWAVSYLQLRVEIILVYLVPSVLALIESLIEQIQLIKKTKNDYDTNILVSQTLFETPHLHNQCKMPLSVQFCNILPTVSANVKVICHFGLLGNNSLGTSSQKHTLM